MTSPKSRREALDRFSIQYARASSIPFPEDVLPNDLKQTLEPLAVVNHTCYDILLSTLLPTVATAIGK